MGDDEGGAVRHQFIQRFADLHFSFHIHGGGGVIQNEDARVDQQSAGDGDALLLPS